MAKNETKAPETAAKAPETAAETRTAETVIRGYLARGYTMRETDAGYWTWEACARDVYAADGTPFKSEADRDAAVRRAAKLLRGGWPNGARLWAALMADVADAAKGPRIVGQMLRVIRFAGALDADA